MQRLTPYVPPREQGGAREIRRVSPGLLAAALCFAAAAFVGAPHPAAAGSVEPLALLSYSPDVTVVLGGTTVAPGNVADDDQIHPPALVDIGAIPAGANLTGYHRMPGGDQLLTFDVTVTLGGLTIGPRDIVRTDGSSYSVFFVGAAHGIPPGTAIDAVAMRGDDLLLSFDVDVVLNGLTIDDADVVRFDGVNFSLFFDSAAAGVPRGLDLDALHSLDSGRLLLSFDGSGDIGGVQFDDEDVLAYDVALETWTLVYDGSTADPGWAGADLDVLYAEPVAPSPTATQPPPTATVSPSATRTATATLTVRMTATLTAVPIATGTATASPTQAHTSTATATPPPATPTSSATGAASATTTSSPTASATATASAIATRSATITPVAGASTTPTSTPTLTIPPSPTATPGGPTGTPTATPSEPTAAPTVTPTGLTCAGDCNGSGEVTIDELIRGVNIALDNLPVSACPAFDTNGSSTVSIDELVRAVNNALNGPPCSAAR